MGTGDRAFGAKPKYDFYENVGFIVRIVTIG
jgi:hypothetical protein